MTEKLLPCPFCGGLAVRWDGEPRIVCNSSGCGGETESEAAWNRRTPAPEGEVVCSGCEGHPAFPNIPCAVCGASPVVPVGVDKDQEATVVSALIAFANAVEGQSRSRRMALACQHTKALVAALGTKGEDHD